jgi:hypothetical protein
VVFRTSVVPLSEFYFGLRIGEDHIAGKYTGTSGVECEDLVSLSRLCAHHVMMTAYSKSVVFSPKLQSVVSISSDCADAFLTGRLSRPIIR